jgi:hypothetical protein
MMIYCKIQTFTCLLHWDLEETFLGANFSVAFIFIKSLKMFIKLFCVLVTFESFNKNYYCDIQANVYILNNNWIFKTITR